MQIDKKQPTTTSIELTINAAEEELLIHKDLVIKSLATGVKLPGFRGGKAPLKLIEKQLDPSMLQSEFLRTIVDNLTHQALVQESLKPVEQPKIEIKKFVPYSVLTYEAKFAVLGPLTLANYKKFKLQKPAIGITESDVAKVIEDLQTRLSDKVDVSRASKLTDQLWINFDGYDAKTKKPINGGSGKDYPLVLGSKTFIPGFEEKLVGAKVGQNIDFVLTFPTDYGVKALAGNKVRFEVTINKVQELVRPKLDSTFAAKAGPFNTVKELKDDLKKQLLAQKKQDQFSQLENEVVKLLVEDSSIDIPEILVDEQVKMLLEDHRKNLVYRGQTMPEFLRQINLTEQEFINQEIKPEAVFRIKATVALAEVSELEGISVTAAEVDTRINSLRHQYKDRQMQEELNKKSTSKEIASRLKTEKTVNRLLEVATTL